MKPVCLEHEEGAWFASTSSLSHASKGSKKVLKLDVLTTQDNDQAVTHPTRATDYD